MHLTYVYQPNPGIEVQAYEKFAEILEKQCCLYQDAFGRKPSLNIYRHYGILIGQVSYDSGINQWQWWNQSNKSGLAWSGVCENFLGSALKANDINRIRATIRKNPEQLCSWDGRFAAVDWQEDSPEVFIITGATDCPSIWYAKGPDGWAIGSRAPTLLDMVGKRPVPNKEAMNLYLASGSLKGDISFFEGVTRISVRTQIVARAPKIPSISQYASVVDYLGPFDEDSDLRTLTMKAADRITSRIQQQLKFSNDPQILLTGGRDSRCIAAAAKKIGYQGLVSTGGAASASDTIIASEVASKLGLRHIYSGNRASPSILMESLDRVKLWGKLSDGIETLRHALAFPMFFREELPFPNKKRPYFHGMGGEIARAYYYPKEANINDLKSHRLSTCHQALLKRYQAEVRLTSKAESKIQATFNEIDNDLADIDPTVAQWLDYYYWKNTCLRWGSDMLSVKSPIYWFWTPLVDRELMRIAFALSPEEKMTSHFVENLTSYLAPELTGLAYDHEIRSHANTKYSSLAEKVIRKLKRHNYLFRQKTNKNLSGFWNEILFLAKEHPWEQFIDKDTLCKLISSEPSSSVLWNAATLELLQITYFERP